MARDDTGRLSSSIHGNHNQVQQSVGPSFPFSPTYHYHSYDALDRTKASEKLLESLIYEKLNFRKSSLSQNHDGTFEWIFKSTPETNAGSTAPSHPDSEIAQAFELENRDASALSIQARQKHHAGQPQEHADLVKWLQEEKCVERLKQETNNRGFFWLSGKPGSGKSTLMKFILKNKQTIQALRQWRADSKIISHFLWKPGTNELQRNLKGLLCSLLYQILSEKKDSVMHLMQEDSQLRLKNNTDDWDMEDLENLLFKAISCSSPCTYLILLDGLDELDVPPGGMAQLFNLLDHLAELDTVKLCVSSRAERAFQDRWMRHPTIHLHELTSNDILIYTTSFLRTLNLKKSDDLFWNITEKVSAKANGVFIWVHFVMKKIEREVNFGTKWLTISQAIDTLPDDIKVLYGDMLRRLHDERQGHKQRAARYFQFLAYDPATVFPISDSGWSAFLSAYRKPPKRMHEGIPVGNIAMLALLAEDELLKNADAPSNISCLEKTWREKCVDAFETLYPVSAGLLEIRGGCKNSPERDVQDWETVQVQFIHRTAIDFLESNEGASLFGEYQLDLAQFLSTITKAKLFNCHVKCQTEFSFFENRYFQEMLRMLIIFDECNNCIAQTIEDNDRTVGLPALSADGLAKRRQKFPEFTMTTEKLTQTLQDLLTVVRKVVSNQAGSSFAVNDKIGSENRFLILITEGGFYKHIRNWRDSDRQEDFVASTFILLGACMRMPLRREVYADCERYGLMVSILQSLRSHVESPGSAEVGDPAHNMVLAWRCFMMHELSSSLDKPKRTQKTDREVMMLRAIQSFINAGCMQELPSMHYLVAVTSKSVEMVPGHEWLPSYHARRRHFEHQNEERTIYIEVNDAFILQQIYSKISSDSESELGDTSRNQAGAAMRPILAVHGHSAKAFLPEVNKDQLKELEAHTFGNKRILLFSRGEVPWIFSQMDDLAKFRSTIDTLKAIGYSLPKANLD